MNRTANPNVRHDANQDSVARTIYRRQYQGALVRSVASAVMWLFSIPAYLSGMLGEARYQGVGAVVLYLILMNPPLLFIGRRLQSRRSLEVWSLVINVMEIIGYTAVIHFVGGLRAGYLIVLFCALIAYVGIIAPKRYPFIIATIASLSITVLAFLERSNVLKSYTIFPPDPSGEVPLTILVTILATIFVGLNVVAYVAWRSSEIIKAGRRQIALRTAELEETIAKKEAVEGDLRASLEEKEVLIKEVHHRVKNNLQVVSSLLSLQSRFLGPGEGRLALKESQARIRSIASIHEMFYRSSDLKTLDLKSFLDNLSKSLGEAFSEGDDIPISVEADRIFVSLDTAIPVGLILHELVSNSVEHSRPRAGEREIRIVLRVVDRNAELTVRDNGEGFPADLKWETANSLGLRIVHSLTYQLGGTVRLSNEGGAVFRITFPLPELPDVSATESTSSPGGDEHEISPVVTDKRRRRIRPGLKEHDGRIE